MVYRGKHSALVCCRGKIEIKYFFSCLLQKNLLGFSISNNISTLRRLFCNKHDNVHKQYMVYQPTSQPISHGPTDRWIKPNMPPFFRGRIHPISLGVKAAHQMWVWFSPFNWKQKKFIYMIAAFQRVKLVVLHHRVVKCIHWDRYSAIDG